MIKLHAGNIKDIIGAAFTVAGHEMDEREATLGKVGIAYSTQLREWMIKERAEEILKLHYPQVFTVTSTTKH